MPARVHNSRSMAAFSAGRATRRSANLYLSRPDPSVLGTFAQRVSGNQRRIGEVSG